MTFEVRYEEPGDARLVASRFISGYVTRVIAGTLSRWRELRLITTLPAVLGRRAGLR